jgi:plastocyanin
VRKTGSMTRGMFLPIAAASLLAVAAGCQPGYHDPRPSADALDLRRQVDEVARAATGPTEQVGPMASPTGFATLRGRFVVTGTPPVNPPLDVTKDHAVCAPGGQQVRGRDVVVGDGGGLQYVVIVVDGVPDEWCHEAMKPGRTEEAVFDQHDCLFQPYVFAVQMSQPVLMTNSDPVDHNTALRSTRTRRFDQTIPARGRTTYQATAEEAEPFPVTCAIHPWMLGYMITRRNSYFAVTNERGEFELPNLPAGVPLNFRVWQSRARGFQQVTVDGAATTWNRGRFTRTLDPDAMVEMNVSVDAAVFGG